MLRKPSSSSSSVASVIMEEFELTQSSMPSGPSDSSLAPARSPGPSSSAADNHDNRNRGEGISEWEAGVSLAKAIMGAGSFALPWAFSKMGYIAGPLVLVLFLGLSVRSIGLLVDCARFQRRKQQKQQQLQMQQQHAATAVARTALSLSYVDVARSTFGSSGAVMAYCASIASSIGVCGSYLVFVAVNLLALLALARGPDAETGAAEEGQTGGQQQQQRRLFLLLVWAVAMPIAVLLSSVKDAKIFARVSLYGDLSVVAGMLAVVVYGLAFRGDGGNDDDADAESDRFAKDCVAIGSLGDMALALGSIGYLFLVHFLVLPIESSMVMISIGDGNNNNNNKSGRGESIPLDDEAATRISVTDDDDDDVLDKIQRDRFQRVVTRTFVVCGCIGGIFGILGYAMFGSETQQIVLLNVEGSIGMAIVQSLLCIDLLLTYPVVMRPSIRILEEHWMKLQSDKTAKKRFMPLRDTSLSAETTLTPSSSLVSLSSVSTRASPKNTMYSSSSDHTPPSSGSDSSNVPLSVGRAQHMTVCIALGVVAAGAGSFVPAFGLLSGLVGGVSQTFLAFVLPPLMWSKQQSQRQQDRLQRQREEEDEAEEHKGLIVPTMRSSSGVSNLPANANAWDCFLVLPWKEKALVLSGAGLIGWTLQSTWSDLSNGVH